MTGDTHSCRTSRVGKGLKEEREVPEIYALVCSTDLGLYQSTTIHLAFYLLRISLRPTACQVLAFLLANGLRHTNL